ncbi:MAG: tetratricopeptide repeat protein [Planctomycetaceae bacterium]|nr:tetratricopeptide repeat protein [Planctomycetaceae bacterium]
MTFQILPTSRSPFAHLLMWGLLGALTGCAGGPAGLTTRGQSDASIQLVQNREYSAGSIQGPTERRLKAQSWEKRREEIQAGPNSQMSADLDRFDAAVALYNEQRYAEAEDAFKKLAKDRRHTYESFGARWRNWWGVDEVDRYDPYSNYGDPIEEDALFMLGQSQYALRHYPAAQDSYDDLLNRYPSTRHLDQVTRQLFRIARYWLDFPETVGDQGDAAVELTSAESKARAKPPSGRKQLAVIPNLTDRSNPVFDSYGRGLQALRSIWLHDATGPLADDALMLSANHNLRTGNYVEAARLYKLLREQYPDSQHFKDAFVLGSHVTLASYQGPEYDSQALEEARELKVAALQLFGDLDPEQRQRLQEEVNRLQRAEEARLWDVVEYYQTKGIPEAVTLHCNLILNRYPDSPYAERARETLAMQAAERQDGVITGWNPVARPAPEQTVQVPANRPRQDGSLPTFSTDPELAPTRPAQPRPSVWQRMGNLLRRADEPPQLESPPSSEPAAADPGRTSL